MDVARDAAAEPQIDVVGQASPGLDLERAGVILEQVLDLAELLPQRRRGDLAFPAFARLTA